jgi:hypothetical protein
MEILSDFDLVPIEIDLLGIFGRAPCVRERNVWRAAGPRIVLNLENYGPGKQRVSEP